LKKSRTYEPESADNLKVSVNLPDLAWLCDGHADVLRKHLQASPEWKVFQDGQQIVSCRRELRNNVWTFGDNGYINSATSSFHALLDARKGRPSDPGNSYQIRYLFRFAVRPGMQHPILSSQPLQFKSVGPLAGEIDLNVMSSDQGIESILAVGKPNLWFEFFEQTPVEERRRTRKTLKWLKEFSQAIRGSEAEILHKGYCRSLMDMKYVGSGEPRMEIAGDDSPAGYSIKTFVNSGEQGFVYLKAKGKGDDKYIEDGHLMNWGAREYIGWSDDPKTLFFYGGRVNLHPDIVKDMDTIRFELWFRPSSGAAHESWHNHEILDSDRLLAVREVGIR
jgi:hypothetical protein